jgi:hypothetical protein
MSSDIVYSKPSGHTLRYRYYSDAPKDYIVECKRAFSTMDEILLTEADDVLPITQILMPPRHSEISLHKHNLHNDFIDALESSCIEKSEKYDKFHDMMIRTYTVPVIDSLNKSDFIQPDIYQPVECPKKSYPRKSGFFQKKTRPPRGYRFYEARKERDSIKNLIRINGDIYDSTRKYKRVNGSLVPITMHSCIKTELDRYERRVKGSVSISKNVTCRFRSDFEIKGFILKPEKMKFEKIYADRKKNSKNNSFIECIVNDPGYIASFEMYYRSTDTDGEWVKLGIFSGNSSAFEDVKISFDEIINMKEFRIVPLSHYGKFEKISVIPFAEFVPTDENDEQKSCTYTVSHLRTPHGNYSKAIDRCGSYKSRRFRMKEKPMKSKFREFKECCDEF